jgi:serine/threonine-protein kinase RsbW
MTAAALVSRMGMTYDDVEDVRIAAEEAFVYAVDTLPEDAEVRFEFSVDDDEVEIVVPLGSEDPSSDEDAERRAAYATFILESVCDTYGFESDENGARLRLVKRVGGADVD